MFSIAFFTQRFFSHRFSHRCPRSVFSHRFSKKDFHIVFHKGFQSFQTDFQCVFHTTRFTPDFHTSVNNIFHIVVHPIFKRRFSQQVVVTGSWVFWRVREAFSVLTYPEFFQNHFPQEHRGDLGSPHLRCFTKRLVRFCRRSTQPRSILNLADRTVPKAHKAQPIEGHQRPP